jgi:glycolate oxidase subunit GlcD
MSREALAARLSAILGEDFVFTAGLASFASDATLARGFSAQPWAAVMPANSQEVAEVVALCYELGVPIVPRGGGTGLAGGAVPVQGGVVVALDRMRAVRYFAPEHWHIEVEAGLPTAQLQRRARESGLFFPPDSGAAEQSQIGGNVATNAGGPQAFKYGATRRWVSGVEVVVAPGRIVQLGSLLRKDVTGYDLTGLLVGSEGTLGLITAASLRLLPAPELRLPLVACFASIPAGCAAVESVLSSGLQPAALDYAEGLSIEVSRGGFPGDLPQQTRFVVLAEVDGAEAEAMSLRAELTELFDSDALAVFAPLEPGEASAIWRWREGISHAVRAHAGGKVTEDVTVPANHFLTAVRGTVEIGARHGLAACSWGHAGDGNLHSTFMVAREPQALAVAERAAEEVCHMALALGGSLTGEHGIGSLKGRHVPLQLDPGALELQRAVKHAFDPKGLFNPGTKLPESEPDLEDESELQRHEPGGIDASS